MDDRTPVPLRARTTAPLADLDAGARLVAPSPGPLGGMLAAVEMCNNNGACRKPSTPARMCPSYRVTRDEQHLTRGRANTLRLALTGQLGPDALASRRRCTRRWSSASPARAASASARPASTWRKMKIEVLRRPRRDARRRALRDRLIADLPRYAALARRLPCLPNLRNRVPGAAPAWANACSASPRPPAAALARATPSAPRRVPRRRPPAAARSCCSPTPSTATSSPRTSAPRCACCAPPATASVACRRRRPALCCGRTYLAAGLVDEARAEARAATLAALRRRRCRSSASSPRAC